MRQQESGFTLVEMMIMILVLAALAAASIINVSGDVNQSRVAETIQEMREIRDAIYGADAGRAQRVSFGYLGDVGSVPYGGQGLQALWEKPGDVKAWELDPADPEYGIRQAARMGAGWSGPYLKDQGVLGKDYSKDAWGNFYEYKPGESKDDSGYLRSFGSDGVEGGTGTDQDIKINLPSSYAFARVRLVIQNAGSVYSGMAEAELNAPLGPEGAMTKYTAVAGPRGNFEFGDKVPFGKRTVKFYFPDIATAANTSGPYEILIDRVQPLIILGTSAKPIQVY